jgi:energy-coupling factor transporter ATP-binding protein EcfA2
VETIEMVRSLVDKAGLSAPVISNTARLNTIRPEVQKNVKILITGPSGIGKSWYATQLSAVANAKLVNLDWFGARVGDKWIIDTSKIPADGIVYEGTGDNVFEWAAANVDIVIIMVPSLSLWKAINTAKAIDYSQNEDLNQVWLSGWEEKAGHSQSEYVKYFIAKLKLYSTPFSKQKIYVVANDADPKRVSRGWFVGKEARYEC